VAGGLEDEEANGSEDSGAGSVQNALQGVDAKGIGQGDFVLAGDEHRTERLGGAAQQEEGAESREVHGVNIPEASLANVGLESLPTQGTNGIAQVDGHDRNQ
jgi:hypothetical protein